VAAAATAPGASLIRRAPRPRGKGGFVLLILTVREGDGSGAPHQGCGGSGRRSLFEIGHSGYGALPRHPGNLQEADSQTPRILLAWLLI